MQVMGAYHLCDMLVCPLIQEQLSCNQKNNKIRIDYMCKTELLSVQISLERLCDEKLIKYKEPNLLKKSN